MKKLVIANWKMNGSYELVEGFANAINTVNNLVVCLPSIFISNFRSRNKDIKLGAQDCSVFEGFGAHTGEISARMLREVGVEYVILGHSERRAISSLDSTQNILRKLRNVLDAGLIPILCVSERYDDLIDSDTEDVLAQQKNRIIVAYEPVSAIGTGKTPTIQEIIRSISEIKRSYNDIRVLYGGSVNQNNAAEILGIDALDGVLVGNASLKLNSLMEILKTVDEVNHYTK
ncbi:MAG: triose-phosphate isomerase [Holosporales bacterium]|jgi:triosephosphate isomerase|nr:triose-phosphate isomerase [Holosporales bacterium]